MTTTIQVRTDEHLKKNVQDILEGLGLDLSTAINMYMWQIFRKKGIPFEILTENGFTPAEEKKILKEIAQAEKSGKSYATIQELHRDILGE